MSARSEKRAKFEKDSVKEYFKAAGSLPSKEELKFFRNNLDDIDHEARGREVAEWAKYIPESAWPKLDDLFKHEIPPIKYKGKPIRQVVKMLIENYSDTFSYKELEFMARNVKKMDAIKPWDSDVGEFGYDEDEGKIKESPQSKPVKKAAVPSETEAKKMKSSDDIRKALLEHGIDIASDDVVFNHLR